MYRDFEIDGRTYSARTLKGAKQEREREIRAALRQMDAGIPKFIVGGGRMIMVGIFFGCPGYEFVDPTTGAVSGGCSMPNATMGEVMAAAQRHLDQLATDLAA